MACHEYLDECIDRSSIIDAVFIVPAPEIKSGLFFCQVLGMFL
jgi:hypothetical protein